MPRMSVKLERCSRQPVQHGKPFAGQKELDDAWIEANPPRELEAEEYKQDFWNTLENEWKTQDHEWLSEFSDNYEPFKEYQFKDENPLRDVTDPLQEGKERLAQGTNFV